jgi:predicted HicB family RNase H-like nuclease
MLLCTFFVGTITLMKKAGRPKQANRRTESLEIRLNENEKRAFQEAAQISGISVSTWVRERLRRAVIRELEEAGRPATFLLGV